LKLYGELSDYIEENWKKLQKNKGKSINLDDYSAQRDILMFFCFASS
jgi:hypothetical protein